eukprot:3408209-Pyramimonas_sp.AAC.2
MYVLLAKGLWGVVCTLAVIGKGGPVQQSNIICMYSWHAPHLAVVGVDEVEHVHPVRLLPLSNGREGVGRLGLREPASCEDEAPQVPLDARMD